MKKADAGWKPSRHYRTTLQGLIHAANDARAAGLPAILDDAAAPLIKAFRHGVIPGPGQVKKTGRKGEPFRELPECLRHRQDDVLRFTTDLRIPPTSSQAERDLRPARTQQKISGRLRSEKATRNRCAIRGYTDTVRKHGANALTAIRDALAGNPLDAAHPRPALTPADTPFHSRKPIRPPRDLSVYLFMFAAPVRYPSP